MIARKSGIALAAFALLRSGHVTAQLTVEGATGEDLGNGLSVQIVRSQHVSNAGRVAYQAGLSGDLSGTVWAWSLDGEFVVREGDPAPGIPGALIFPGHEAVAGEHGLLYFAYLTGVPADSSKVLVYGEQVVARENDPAPGTDLVYSDNPHDDKVIVQGDHVAFVWGLREGATGTPVSGGLFKGPVDDIEVVIQSLDPTPGLPGDVFGAINTLALSPSNRAAILGVSLGPDDKLRDGIWLTDEGTNLSYVTSEGAQGPPGIGVIEGFSYATFIDSDQLLIHGRGTDGRGAWIHGNDTSLVKVGDTVEGHQLTDIGHAAANTHGMMVFLCYFPDFDGLCLSNPSTGLELLLKEGDSAPGVEGDWTVNAVDFVLPFINQFGHIVFAAGISGDDSHRGVIYFRDAAGNYTAIVRTLESYDLGDYGMATFSVPWDFWDAEKKHGIYDGGRRPMTDSGKVVFSGRFGNAQGIFDAVISSIPSPDLIFAEGFGEAIDP